jgi:hypothetical protein
VPVGRPSRLRGALVPDILRRYTPDMREYLIPTLVLFCLPCLSAQDVPAGSQIVKDPKGACQLAVPADWSPYGESHSAAVLRDTSTALAVVTRQPGQTFSPLTEFFQRVLNIPKEKLFENTAKRIFYQDKTSKSSEDPNSYTFSVPGKAGTCSGHLTFLPSITEDVARKIALSLGPVQ